jgi:hypothetical protein
MTPRMYLTGRKGIFITLVMVAMINVFFFYTYPINVGASDNSGYLLMIYQGTSNLIFAPGYPTIFNFLLKLLDIPFGVSLYDTDWLQQLQLIQLIAHLALFSLLFFLCIDIFGTLSAIIAALFLSLCPIFMGGANSISPEWLQAYCIVFSFLFSIKAFTAGDQKRKIVFYTLSSVIFTAAFLVKYNSALVLPVLLCVFVADDIRCLQKIMIGISLFAFSYFLIFLFVANVHYPTTNSKQLNYDHAWVLVSAIPNGYFALPPNRLKINSKRWRALSSIVPPVYEGHAYTRITDIAPQEIRQPYLNAYHEIMNFTEEELKSFIKKNPLPDSFITVSSTLPLYWYIGLPEIDELGVAVYKESLLTLPLIYRKRALDTLKGISLLGMQMVPFHSSTLGLIINLNERDDQDFIRVSPPPGTRGAVLRYWNPREIVWEPGMSFFEKISWQRFPRWSEIGIYIIALLGVCLSGRRTNLVAGLLCIGVTTIWFVASSMLQKIRWKEVLAILPFIAIFFGIGISSIFYRLRNHYRSAIHSGTTASTSQNQ